jgi:hypothetical protein
MSSPEGQINYWIEGGPVESSEAPYTGSSVEEWRQESGLEPPAIDTLYTETMTFVTAEEPEQQ